MRILIFTISLCFTLSTQAQVFYRLSEFGAAAGSSAYFGDLNTNYGFNHMRYSGSLFYRYNFSPYIAMRAQLGYARIGYADSYNTNYFERMRNLSFESDIFEGVIMADFHFFRYEIGDFDYRFTPYVTLGAGMFYHNPYARLEGKKYYLRPLGTEGQNYEEYKDRRYGKTAMAFPIGAGVKFWFSHGITVFAEVANRSTTTDYIDDVSTTYIGKDKFIDITPSPYPLPAELLQDRSTELSSEALGKAGKQRGISTTRDKYMMLQIGISFRLPTYKCPSNLLR